MQKIIPKLIDSKLYLELPHYVTKLYNIDETKTLILEINEKNMNSHVLFTYSFSYQKKTD